MCIIYGINSNHFGTFVESVRDRGEYRGGDFPGRRIPRDKSNG